MGRVKHPNIVPVYEADIQDRQPYLVFEYIAGKTLDQILKQRGALAPQEAVALMMDVLDAVSVAHAADVVHRDLKPSNVLVDAAGRARVMDFGIAARIPDRNSTDSPWFPVAERWGICHRKPPTAQRPRHRWTYFRRVWCWPNC